MPKPGMRRITVYVPEDLLHRAMKVSGLGISATVRLALEALVAGAKAMRPLVWSRRKARPRSNRAG
jgi:post-segregation antitoxin (ccd killing protein)